MSFRFSCAVLVALTTSCAARDLDVTQAGQDGSRLLDAAGTDLASRPDLTSRVDAAVGTDAAAFDLAAADLAPRDIGGPDLLTVDVATPGDLSSSPDLSPACPMQPGTGTEATTERLNPFHDGYQPGENIAPPLFLRWTVSFGAGYARTPVATGGKVFVTESTDKQGVSSQLWAFSRDSGALLWGPVPYGGGRIAADDEHVVAMSDNGDVLSYEASSGQQEWTAQSSQGLFFASPVVSNGSVYFEGCGEGCVLSSYDVMTGTLNWSMLGSNPSPTVVGADVFLNLGAGWSRAYDASNGTTLWTATTTFMGDGTYSAIYHDGLLYTPDEQSTLLDIRNPQDGSLIGTLQSDGPWPVFDGDHAFVTRGGGTPLYAVRLSTGADEWSLMGVDGPVVGANGYLFAISGGDLVAIDETNGSFVWTTPLLHDRNVLPVGDLAIADGVLYYVQGSTLVAYSGCP